MADVFTEAKRSEIMSAIRGRGNKSTEQALAAALRQSGVTGWRRHIAFRIELNISPATASTTVHARRVIRPDFTFRCQRVVVFVDGCFWHMCPIHQTKPKQNAEFWREKLAVNVARDKATNKAFRQKGWTVVRIWEHELKAPAEVLKKMRRRLSTAAERIVRHEA